MTARPRRLAPPKPFRYRGWAVHSEIIRPDPYVILRAERKLPKGETFTLPDGTVYQGVAEDENNQIFSETDNAGIVTYITINKATGEIVSKADGGKIGKSSKTTPSPTVPPKFTASELKKLEQAGLTNAPRQEQLDYFYKKKTDDDEDIF